MNHNFYREGPGSFVIRKRNLPDGLGGCNFEMVSSDCYEMTIDVHIIFNAVRSSFQTLGAVTEKT